MQQNGKLDVFLAVGHGVEPDGVFDPGAIGTDGRQEHAEAFQVCTYALAAMRRSGLTVVCETAQGASHDPDFHGSAKRANELQPRVAIEVHFDWSQGVDGFSGLYFSDDGRALAGHIGAAFKARGLPRAADVRRPGLLFLNSTQMPALIPEIRRVHDWPDAQNRAQGEALAEGTCAFLGHAFWPPQEPGAKSQPQPQPQPQPAGHAPVTPDSPLLAPASAPSARAEQYLLARPHGGYSAGDVTEIVGLYYTTAGAVGLDPLLVVAQMAEETSHLTSFWSQRPRRNFAGIGVTGQPGAGLSFPDLKTAVRAHAGRLLAYSLPSGTGSPAQSQLIDEALAARPLPPQLRGAAATLKGLAGTWAQDPQYAVKLAGVANDIRTDGS
jgi:N-acetylmuramoyl-L-alanine amidase/Mannosyl-glycoprotein endo-beta-N-acetylglucosaminidase